MTEQFLEDYFTSVATTVKDIGHTADSPAFYRMSDPNDLDEFDNAVKNMAKSCCLLLEIGSGNLGDWDNMNDSPRIGLHVLNKTPDNGFATLNAARDQAKATLLKIVALIKYDCKDQFQRTDNQTGPLKAVNVVFDSQIKWGNMTGIDGNWYGKSFYFDFRSPLNNPFNPDNYN